MNLIENNNNDKIVSSESIFTKNFAKKSDKVQIINGLNSIIYTRVSDPEQEKNQSLSWQKKYCEEFCKRNNFTVLEYFGGRFESAKTDERKEFQKMLKYIKNSRNKVSNVVVFCMDRFSRSGATWLVDQLRTYGVRILSVTQPADSNTANGRWFQKMQILIAELDNEMRKEKCVTGMREKLLRGEWAIKPPLGYDKVKIDGKTVCIINDIGKLLRKAFHWKAKENIQNEEIISRLEKMGLKIRFQKISTILRNPFYCGLLSNTLIDGLIVKGNHEPLVSEEIFLQVNDLLSKNAHGHKNQTENEAIPLRSFIKCKECGYAFVGYEVKKKHLFYYKCQTKGCRCNRSVKHLHNLFLNNIELFAIEQEYIPAIKEEFITTFNELFEEESSNMESIKSTLTETKKDLKILNERWALGKISDEVYNEFAPNYKRKIKEIEDSLENSSKDTSNLETLFQSVLEYASKLKEMWQLSDFKAKQRLQYLIFPEGMQYDREIDALRTTNVNPIFAFIACGISNLHKTKKGIINKNINYSCQVELVGIEPTSGDGFDTAFYRLSNH